MENAINKNESLHEKNTNLGVSKNRWYPQIIHFNRVLYYKPSILGYPYFWKHPYLCLEGGTLPETNIFAPENGWLEYDPFLWGWPIFRGGQAVSFREGMCFFHEEIHFGGMNIVLIFIF